MTDRPALRLVDTETGEVMPAACPHCPQLEAELDSTTRRLRAAWRRIDQLQADQAAEHRSHERHGEVVALFDLWRRLCRHPRARLDYGPGSRFERLLWALGEYGEQKCRRVIVAAAYDPNSRQTRNGRVERYDDPTTVFKNAAAVERYFNRAPADWRERLEAA